MRRSIITSRFKSQHIVNNRAFTLVELLVSIAVLALLILLITRLVNSATSITTLGNKHMDADSHARPVLDRMALDFVQMLKRKDISYYVKTGSTTMAGNDWIGFYSTVQGYFSAHRVLFPSSPTGSILIPRIWLLTIA